MLVNSTIEDVTHKAHVSYDSMVGVLERCVADKVDWERFDDLNVLGIDEIALKKGQRDYVVIVSARQKDGALAVLGVLPDRSQATVKAFLDSIPARLRDTITTTCCDLYDSYLQASRASLQRGLRGRSRPLRQRPTPSPPDGSRPPLAGRYSGKTRRG